MLIPLLPIRTETLSYQQYCNKTLFRACFAHQHLGRPISAIGMNLLVLLGGEDRDRGCRELARLHQRSLFIHTFSPSSQIPEGEAARSILSLFRISWRRTRAMISAIPRPLMIAPLEGFCGGKPREMASQVLGKAGSSSCTGIQVQNRAI